MKYHLLIRNVQNGPVGLGVPPSVFLEEHLYDVSLSRDLRCAAIWFGKLLCSFWVFFFFLRFIISMGKCALRDELALGAGRTCTN